VKINHISVHKTLNLPDFSNKHLVFFISRL